MAAETFVPPACGLGRPMLDATFELDDGLRPFNATGNDAVVMLFNRQTWRQSADQTSQADHRPAHRPRSMHPVEPVVGLSSPAHRHTRHPGRSGDRSGVEVMHSGV